MTMVSRFEDVQAWQEARKLVNMVYKLTSSGPLAKILGSATKYSEPQFLQ